MADGTAQDDPAAAAELRTDRPHPARVYDYLLGGKDNFEADRAAAEQGIKANPNSLIPPRQNRAFLRRVVRYLAGEAGITLLGFAREHAFNIYSHPQRILTV